MTAIETDDTTSLWVRGGFPASLLAADDATSMTWRKNFIRTYLERDIPLLGPRIPAETLRRFWTMLAHNQAAPLNAARIAAGLGVSAPTVARYLDLMVDLLLVVAFRRGREIPESAWSRRPRCWCVIAVLSTPC